MIYSPAAKHVRLHTLNGVSCALKRPKRWSTEAVKKGLHVGALHDRSLACNFSVLLTTPRVTVMETDMLTLLHRIPTQVHG